MKSLSPSAQVVLDAFESSQFADAYALALALRAAADQVVPDEPDPGESQFWDDEADREWQNNQHFRSQLHAIAAELEGADD